jgi:hypothetical protein
MLGAGIFIMLASIWILKIPKVKDRQSKKEI